jgi:hypothetical protein
LVLETFPGFDAGRGSAITPVRITIDQLKSRARKVVRFLRTDAVYSGTQLVF